MEGIGVFSLAPYWKSIDPVELKSEQAMKKVVLIGGTGHMGAVAVRHLDPRRYRFVVVTRRPRNSQEVAWDGRTQGEWAEELDGADVVINLAGRSVNCRYTPANLKVMMDSRIESTRAVGVAIANCAVPPKVWLQASTATIYAHTFGAANDEATGVLAGNEVGVPKIWAFSAEIAKRWEATLEEAQTPNTRKVAMRMAIMMSRDEGGPFDILASLTRKGLGGKVAGGRQFVSWIHEVDLARAFEFLMDSELSGPVNLSSPNPLSQGEFAAILRRSLGVPIGLGATKWMVDIAAYLMNSHSELVLKSRRVVPTRLVDAGFQFRFPTWNDAVADLVRPSH